MGGNKQLSDQLRAAVLSADETRYKISKATGIPEGNLSRFVHGGSGLSMESVDLLCKYLGLRLVKGDRPKTSKSKRKR